MNWTVRRRFTARAARDGAMRIAVDTVIVLGGVWGKCGGGRGIELFESSIERLWVSFWILEESDLQKLCRSLLRRDVRSVRENSLVMSAMMRRSTPARVGHPTSVELTDRAISERVYRILRKAPNFI